MTVAIFHRVAWQMRKIDKLSLFVLMGVCGLARAYCVAQKMNKSPKKIYCLITKIISNHSTNSKSETPKVLYDIYSSSNNNLQPATLYRDSLKFFKIQWLTYFLRFLRRYIKLWMHLEILESIQEARVAFAFLVFLPHVSNTHIKHKPILYHTILYKNGKRTPNF